MERRLGRKGEGGRQREQKGGKGSEGVENKVNGSYHANDETTKEQRRSFHRAGVARNESYSGARFRNAHFTQSY